MNYVRSRDAQKQLARTSLRSIKWLKFIKTAIKVYIPHEKLCFCCFLTVSCHINAILASCNVLVFQLLSNDPGKVDSNFFCYVATVLSPHRNVLIFTQRMYKPT